MKRLVSARLVTALALLVGGASTATYAAEAPESHEQQPVEGLRLMDSDGDGLANTADPGPYDPHVPGDIDSDGDGIPNERDPLPTVSDIVPRDR